MELTQADADAAGIGTVWRHRSENYAVKLSYNDWDIRYKSGGLYCSFDSPFKHKIEGWRVESVPCSPEQAQIKYERKK